SFTPLFHGYIAAVRGCSGEDFTSAFDEGLVFGADHQFVIYAEAALIEVCRTDIDEVVDDDEFGMENLRFVFSDLRACFQEPAVEAASGKLSKADIRFAGQDQLDCAAGASHMHQRAP